MRFLLAVILCLLSAHITCAQVREAAESDTSFCVPTIIGMPRTKGIILRQEYLMDYGIRSIAKDGTVANGEISTSSRFEFKLRMPVISSPGFALSAGFHYSRENYRFEDPEAPGVEIPLFRSMEEKSLHTIGGAIYVAKPLRGNKYILLRVSGDLNGDYHMNGYSKTSFLQFNVAPLFGWKRHEKLSYAVGFTYGNIFGRHFISPVFSYHHTFNRHWGVEALLPSKVKLRYTLNEHTLLYASTELNGARYRVNFGNALLPQQDLFMQRAAVRYLVTFEREIHDWLWFSLEAGMQSNINFTLSDQIGPTRKALINNQLNHATFAGFSLFAVPPRKFVNRH
jgi:hypothetical protein